MIPPFSHFTIRFSSLSFIPSSADSFRGHHASQFCQSTSSFHQHSLQNSSIFCLLLNPKASPTFKNIYYDNPSLPVPKSVSYLPPRTSQHEPVFESHQLLRTRNPEVAKLDGSGSGSFMRLSTLGQGWGSRFQDVCSHGSCL